MVAGELSTKVVTVPVTSGPQLNDQEFQGWYIQPGGTLEAINCGSGSSLLTTGGYAECCALGATDCTAFFTACVGTASAVGVATEACSVCQTMSIYDQFPINGDPVYQILCVPDSWPASSIYRTVITSTTTYSVLEVNGASPSATSNIASSTGQASRTGKAANTRHTTGNGQASSTGQVSSGSTSSKDPTANTSSSTAWIAGAIIGPVLALIIILALILWLLRRKKKQLRPKNTAFPPRSQYGPPGAASGGMMSYGNQYSDHPYEVAAYKHQSYHMAGGNERHEMPIDDRSHELQGNMKSSRNTPYELSDSN